jgi:hypothetical protein
MLDGGWLFPGLNAGITLFLVPRITAKPSMAQRAPGI